jgi:hypothetical protein
MWCRNRIQNKVKEPATLPTVFISNYKTELYSFLASASLLADVLKTVTSAPKSNTKLTDLNQPSPKATCVLSNSSNVSMENML